MEDSHSRPLLHQHQNHDDAADHDQREIFRSNSEPISCNSRVATNTNLEEVEEILEYNFNNKLLLEEALTHSSVSQDFSYERLEYFGDAVLNLLISKEQYYLYPQLSPGPLTRLRSANVCTEKLARVAIKFGLHRYLRHNKPILDEQIERFSKEILDYPLHSNGLVVVPSVLADLVESIIGAVFFDSNCSLEIVWKVFKGMLEPNINEETLTLHPVTQLYELCQKKKAKIKFVDFWDKEKVVHVYVNNECVGSGFCSLKKEVAQNRAAKEALDNFDKISLHEEEEETRSVSYKYFDNCLKIIIEFIKNIMY